MNTPKTLVSSASFVVLLERRCEVAVIVLCFRYVSFRFAFRFLRPPEESRKARKCKALLKDIPGILPYRLYDLPIDPPFVTRIMKRYKSNESVKSVTNKRRVRPTCLNWGRLRFIWDKGDGRRRALEPEKKTIATSVF